MIEAQPAGRMVNKVRHIFVALKIYACIIHLLYSFKHLDKTLYTHAYTHYKFVLYQYIWPCIEVSDDIVYMNITGSVSFTRLQEYIHVCNVPL